MRKTVLTILSAIMFIGTLNAQQLQSDKNLKRSQMLELNKQMTTEQINDYYSKVAKRKPALNPAMLPSVQNNQTVKDGKTAQVKQLDVPEDMIFPIESDEVQAILIEWPQISRQEGTNAQVEALFEDIGMLYNWTTGGYTFCNIVSTPDVSPNSDYAKLHGKLADAIQKHAQVWIVVWHDDDTTTIKEYMADRGTPLENYRFFVHHGNSFWARDWGPVAFYYGDDDKIAFMDFEYYGGRPMDDQLPIQIAKDLGWDCYTNTIEYEGGNILVDGLGSLFTTSALYETNKDTYGLYVLDTTDGKISVSVQTKNKLSEAQVQDSVKHLMNLTNMVVVPALQYDGGTGHIDLYADMWEETGFVAAKYPDTLSSWADAKKVENNINTFTSQTNYFGNNYDVVRVPLPKKNNGKWYSSGSDYNKYTRCWANHTFVNDAIIQPVFYDTTLSGAKAGDVESNKKAIEVMKQCYPGYTFEEIDVRSFDGFGGAIHCITKQIPADNPVRIYHQPARFYNTTANGNTYSIEVLSQNKSGISNVSVYYKTVAENEFHELPLVANGNNLYKAQIVLDANIDNDTLLYYISSTSNNGKTITKPMTAHQGGYYIMPYGKSVSTYNNDFAYDTTNYVGLYNSNINELNSIGEVYPQPATSQVNITVNNSADLYYRIVNLKGQVQQNGKIAKQTAILTLDVQNLKAGSYWIVFTDGNISTSRSLIIAK